MQLKLPFLAAWPWGSVLLPLKRKLDLSVPPPFPQLAESKRASEKETHRTAAIQSIAPTAHPH